MPNKHPFIIHACVKSYDCETCLEELDEDEGFFATHTHGLKDVGMLEMVICRNEMLDKNGEARIINFLYDYYYENNDIYEQFLSQEIQYHHMHPKKDLKDTDLVVIATIQIGDSGIIKHAYEGMNVKDKEFIGLGFFIEEEFIKLRMENNIMAMRGI